MSQVTEDELMPVLAKVRDLRTWAIRRKIDTWTLRQGLLIALEIDTQCALQAGVSIADLTGFDDEVRKDIRAWVDDLMRL